MTRTTFKELLETAKEQLKELTTVDHPDFRLEQAEYNEAENVWEIVVSYLVENTNKRTTALAPFGSEFQFHRIYKRMKINQDNSIAGLYIFNT